MTHMAPGHVDLDSQQLSRSERNLIKLAKNVSTSFFTVNNELEIFTIGRDKFEALKRDMRAARESIYLQYYIFSR